MPNAPKRPCLVPGCPKLIDRGAVYGRCPEHASRYDSARGTAPERGYTREWAKVSRLFRQRFPLCGMRADGQLYQEHSRCVQEGRFTTAQCVDHIVSMNNGGSQY